MAWVSLRSFEFVFFALFLISVNSQSTNVATGTIVVNITRTSSTPPQCSNNQWFLFGESFDVKVTVGLFGGPTFTNPPMAETIQDSVSGNFAVINQLWYLNGEAADVAVSEVFNVNQVSNTGNQWSFALEDDEGNIGATFGVSGECSSTIPTLTVVYTSDSFINGIGTIAEGQGDIPAVSAPLQVVSPAVIYSASSSTTPATIYPASSSTTPAASHLSASSSTTPLPNIQTGAATPIITQGLQANMQNNYLSGGAVAGIVIAVLVVVFVAGGVAAFFLYKKRSGSSQLVYPHVQMQNNNDPFTTKPLPPIPVFSEGSQVWARFSGDGKEYRAIVESTRPGPQYLVRYIQYGTDKEWLPASSVRQA